MADKPGSSHADNVASLHGGEIMRGTPNAGCVAKLRELLERAEAGDITGIVCAALHSDVTASYSIAGCVGPYSLAGAVDMAHAELIGIMKARHGGG